MHRNYMKEFESLYDSVTQWPQSSLNESETKTILSLIMSNQKPKFKANDKHTKAKMHFLL
jgi:hypothetical protein